MEASPLPGGIYHIQTDPGDDGWFSPPVRPNDYSAWLFNMYEEAQMKDGNQLMYYGFAQHVNQILHAVAHSGLKLRYEGEYASDARIFLEGMLQ